MYSSVEGLSTGKSGISGKLGFLIAQKHFFDPPSADKYLQFVLRTLLSTFLEISGIFLTE
jgi:hypothetical protein